MNFKAIPELEWVWEVNGHVIPVGYIFAIGLMIFISCFTFWFFKFKKWL